jgi:hypothetical protein
MWFVAVAFLMVLLVFGRLVASISRISEVNENHIEVKPMLGNVRRIPLTGIVDLTVFRLGWLTHALIRVKQPRFLSLAHTTYLVPVRGRYMDQQGMLGALWERVPSVEERVL